MNLKEGVGIDLCNKRKQDRKYFLPLATVSNGYPHHDGNNGYRYKCY